jgi:hypothetical protein
MGTPHDSFAEALYEAHTDLLRDLQDLEKAVGARSPEGPADLVTRLGKVRTHLLDHFLFEEEGGYMAPVLKEEPRFVAEAKELLAEHRQMARTLDSLIKEVGQAPTVQHDLWERVRAWVGQVRHHEARENHLVQEAYYSTGATGD